ncbi:MAG TPA: 50S ribosomal protein L15 [Candidatus Brocadiia bacterium]|nr:50S ribosomal protein L15 [Planctomycetota bacterium]MDO8092447.1 50S ribosomal protein L15 [Candidatus Brocadiales bacterium]
MNLIDVKATPFKRKRKKRVGAGPGSGHGKTSGRGGKGTTARSGTEYRPYFEGGQMPLFRRLPKRGFHNPFKKLYDIVNIKDLECFDEGTVIDPEKMQEKGIVKNIKDGVKVLGDGELKKPLTVVAHKFSKTAVEKIKASGGEVKIIP